MQLASLQTIAFVWCIVFASWVVKSSSEASDNPNGLTDGHSQGTVEGVHPSKSDTENVPEQSSKRVSTQVIGPLPKRHLVQSSPVPSEEDSASCRLTQLQRRWFYNRTTRVWNVTDVVLEELDNDVQSIVDCTASNDAILFSTARTVQPRRTITITRNLTLSSQSDGPLFTYGSIAETKRKVRFTCSSTGSLLVIRTDSVLIANVVFEDCSGTANVVSINATCDESSVGAGIHFLHVEFRNLSLSGDQHLTEAVQPACAHLQMEHVIVRENLCGTNGCLSLSMNNTLIDIEVVGNRAENNNDSMVSPSVFVLPSDSEIFATNISALRNRLRLFNVVNSTFTITHSYFNDNAISPVDQAIRTTIGGCVLLSNHSTIDIRDSVFVNNSGWTGGAIYSTSSRMTLSNVSFHRNSADGDGSAIYLQHGNVSLVDVNVTDNISNDNGTLFIHNSSVDVRGVLFSGNVISGNGGGMCSSSSNITVATSVFDNNSASNFGGAICVKDLSRLQIRTTIIRNNTSRRRGGALYVIDGDLALRRTNFTNNTSSSGGGCYFRNIDATLEYVLLLRNRAMGGSGGGIYLHTGRLNGESLMLQENYVDSAVFDSSFFGSDFRSGWNLPNGGAISATRGIVVINRSTFNNNNVTFGEGGALFFGSCNATIRASNFSSNRATDHGGIIAKESSRLNATNISLHSNIAEEDGGGIGIDSGSSLLCYRCNFISNVATWGGGIAITSDDSLLIVAQIQDSVFLNNSASGFGGGLHFNRPKNLDISCGTPNNTCSRVALLNTTFVNNSANISGSAILTTEPEVVLVSCKPVAPLYHFSSRDGLNRLDVVHPKRLCDSWIGNVLAPDAIGDVVGTYGRGLSISIDDDDEVQMIGRVESGFALENVASGRPLPIIYITVVDAFGNGPFVIQPRSLVGTVTSPDGFFQGNIPIDVIGGSGDISHVVGFQIPGNYTIRVSLRNTEFNLFAAYELERRIINWGDPDDCIDLLETNITVHVRECQIGEEPTSTRELCEECDVVSYNFDPSEVGGCTPCPDDATCENRFIVPRDGYWHKSPCHVNVQECLIEKACAYGERQAELNYYSDIFFACDFNESMLTNYNRALCREGYEGLLCGSCTESYGLSLGFKCSKCAPTLGSLLTLILITLYLFIVSSFTIRGGLPLKRKTGGASTSSRSGPRRTQSTAQGEEEGRNLEMVAINMQVQTPSAHIREKKRAGSSTTRSPIQFNEAELTRWITSEILKVMINFLQVTTVASSMNVEWTEGMLTMFEADEYVGALSSTALSRPIDCIVSSDSASIRSFWRTFLNILIPIVVVTLFVAMWWFITNRKKKGMSYFWKRVILSVIVVTYISYLGLTRLAVRAFYCVDVHDSEDAFIDSHTKYWAIDTSIRCYEKEHVGLIVIAVLVLALVSLSFPLGSAIFISQNKVQHEQTDSWTYETMGFLYRAFKEKYMFWESVVMLRKACLSIIVVFSYPLGGRLQGLLALGVLLLCLYLQMACSPYREAFHRLNHYESGSLLVSCLTFIFGQILDADRCSDSTRSFVEVLAITLNVCFFSFLLFTWVKSGLNHIRVLLEFEDFPIDDNTSWWVVLKIYIKSRMSKVKLPTN